MKKNILLAIACCYALQNFAQIPSQMGLVGDYPFSGNAKDMSMSKNDGMVYGATLTKDRFGKENSAYYFDGMSYIIFPAKNIENNYYSISAWIKIKELPTESQSAAGILDIGNDGGDQFLYVASKFGFSMINYVKNNSPMNYSIGTLPKIETWYHLTVTRDDKYLIFYINGELKGLMTVQGFLPSYSTNPVGTIGGRLNGNKQFFNGTIDDVKIYSRALAETEVISLHNAEVITSNEDAEANTGIAVLQNNLEKNKFKIETEQNFSGEVMITNLQGQTIFETKILNLLGSQNVEISAAYKGLCILSVTNSFGQSLKKKFILE
jgi:hypothetical protein